MPRPGYVWAKALTPARKAEITAACEALVVETRARFLPEIRPTAFNYPVDIRGRWRGESYSFIVRYRSGFPENEGEEFDAPYARIDHFNDRFGVQWMRHTGRWWPLRDGLTLEEAVDFVRTEPVLRPVL
ncbi:MAG: hypothetical protein U1E40_03145 [Amaricoccus sp.]